MSSYAFGHVGQQQSFTASEVGYSGAWALVNGNASVATATLTGATLTVTSAGIGKTTIGVRDAFGQVANVAISVSSSTGGITTHAPTFTTFATASREPFGIATGSDGNLWVTAVNGSSDAIIRITPSGTQTVFPLPIGNSKPLGIAAGSDGNLWAVENATNKIARITTSGTITEFSVGGANLHNIVSAPDGNLWFDETGASPTAIGRISTKGALTTFPLEIQGSVDNNPSEYLPSLANGPDGMLWYISAYNNQFARITTAGFAQPYYNNVNAPAHLTAFAAGPDGMMWFTDAFDSVVGMETADGRTLSTVNLPTSGSGPGAMTLGSDGAFWIVEENAKQLARVTIGGAVSEYPAPLCATCVASSIITGPDGNLWYTSASGVTKVQL